MSKDSGADIEYEWAIMEPLPSWQDKAPREHILTSKNPSPFWGYVILTLTVAVAIVGMFAVFA